MLLSPSELDYLGKVKVTELPGRPRIYNRTHEKDVTKRVGFIHRKQDRFTFTVRFIYENTTSAGKIYRKWRTLNTLSATIKDGRLNLFFSGHMFNNKFFTGVSNITRQPFMVTLGFMDEDLEMLKLINSELEQLLIRNKITADADFSDLNKIEENILKVAYPSWIPQKYKTSYYLRDEYRYTLPPVFATDILRMSSYKEVANLLFTSNDTALEKQFLSDPAKFLTPEALFILMLGKKRVGSQALEATLEKLFSRNETALMRDPEGSYEPNLYETQLSKLTFKDLMSLRSLTKLLTVEQRQLLLEDAISSKKIMADFILSAVKHYNRVKPNLKANPNLLLDELEGLEEGLNWEAISRVLYECGSSLFEKAASEERPVIYQVRQMVVDSPHWRIPATWDNTEVIPKLHTDFYCGVNLPVGKPEGEKEAENSYFRKKDPNIYTIPLQIYTTEQFRKTYYYSVVKRLGLQRVLFDTSLQFSHDEYELFLKELLSDAEKTLKKAKYDVTPGNVALHLALVHTLTFSAKMLRFKGFVTPKAYKLLSDGHSMYSVLHILRQRISIETAKDYVGLPETWLRAVFEPNSSEDESIAF
jgi:hypothetical protein